MSSTVLDRIEQIEQEILQINQTVSTTEHYGMAMVSESSSVTDANSGLVLSAKEKNAALSGTIMNILENVKGNVGQVSDASFSYRGVVTNFNAVEKAGFYDYWGANGIGAPVTNAWGILLNLRGGSYKGQIFLSFEPTFRYIYVRGASSATSNFGSWKNIPMQG